MVIALSVIWSGLALSTTVARAAASWQIDTVADGTWYSSLELDRHGWPHVAYNDDDDLMYAYFDGDGWHTELVQRGTGRRASLVLDSSGNPHILHAGTDLLYSSRIGGSWQTETAAAGAGSGEGPSLALDSRDRPHISHTNSTTRVLYTHRDSGGWHTETVDDTGTSFRETSLALNGAGEPRIVYKDLDRSVVDYAARDAEGWQRDSVAAVTNRVYPSLVLTAAGSPVFSHRGYNALLLSSNDGGGWNTETVSTGGYFMFTSVALDGSGSPGISYYEVDSTSVNYVSWVGGQWVNQSVTAVVDGEAQTSVAMDCNGSPRIVYHSSNQVKFAAMLAEPAAPTIMSAAPADSSAQVAFAAPCSTGGAALTDYEYRVDAGAWTSAGLTSPMTIAGLDNGTAYSVQVRAVNSVGAGAASDAVSVTPRTVPGAPVIGAAVPGDGSARIVLGAASDGGSPITGYEYNVDGGSWTAGGAHGPVRIEGLTNGRQYSVRIRASNAAGTGPASSPAAVTPRRAPGGPVITSVAAGDRSARVAFTAPKDDGGSPIAGYEYRLHGGDWTPAGPGSSPISLTGLTNGTAYSVRVRAVNAAGPGAGSAPAGFTPSATPPASLPKAPLTVKARGKAKKLPVGKASAVVGQARTGGRIATAAAVCAVDGEQVSKKKAKRVCTIKITKKPKKATITVTPRCSSGLTVTARVAATKKGHRTTRWTRTWKVKANPRTDCR